MEEVKLMGLTLLLAMSQGAASGDPFNSYLNSVKEHRTPPGLTSFASECGFDLKQEKPIYAVSVGKTWVRSLNLAKAVYGTESDFFSSSEVWTKDGTARVIVLWSLSLDVGSEIRTMACISDDGKPRKLQVTNWSFPVDREGQKWTHQQYKTFDKGGRVILNQGHFEDSHGRQIEPPKLDEDNQGSFDWVPDTSAFLKIESDLLNANRVSTGKR
ncbi:MAG TPA: hypothetical protein VIX90_07220 [Edaphobacter sp.]